MEYVKLQTETGEIICFEIHSKAQEASREQQVASHRKIKESLVYKAESFFDTISGFANGMCKKLRECNASEIEIEFGLSLDVSTGEVLSVVVNGSTNATMTVKLTWKEDEKE